MRNKIDRLHVIKEIVTQQAIGNQDELLHLLKEQGFSLTQATLSRDLKRLKITKIPNDMGEYRYTLPSSFYTQSKRNETKTIGSNSLEFSGQLAVVKTRSGYAGGIAAEIDEHASNAILGTIAGDDTILVIPREGFNRDEITYILSSVIEKL
ncbi:MAG: ArgR family transcriptional regulator [Paludibacteraceae bacterium]|nr:ArgR family transcriptional regulator [Paludibacteraceae bacterium]